MRLCCHDLFRHVSLCSCHWIYRGSRWLPTRLPGDERERSCELSNEKTSGCLGYLLGWNPTQLCGDYVINHYKDPYETTSISWEVRVVFFVFFREVGFCLWRVGFREVRFDIHWPYKMHWKMFFPKGELYNILMSRHQKNGEFCSLPRWSTNVLGELNLGAWAGSEGMKSYHELHTIMVATHIIICHFHPELIGEMIQFDEYFSDGLVQPPTR